MKIAKRLLPLFLVFVFFLLLGLSRTEQKKSEIETVIKSELDLLKNLDSDTVQKYISYRELFSDAGEESELSDDIQEVFSLFFQDFDYKILKLDVNTKANTATASLRLTTIDARVLAQDYTRSLLRFCILHAADSSSEDMEDTTPTTEERYLLLGQLLKENTYETIETDSTIQLTRKDDKSDSWEIKRTQSLENNLVGGLMTYLSDNNILSPEETLSVYLDTLEEMDTDEMSNYLGINSLMSTDDDSKKQIAAALVDQVRSTFHYQITNSTLTEGYEAVVETEITTFDSDSILSSYQKELQTYLDSADAVIDGSTLREEKSYEMLLHAIEDNQETIQAAASFHLSNDGLSWNLTDGSEELGNAIFGTLASTLTEEEAETN
jgi:hypothetical protein